MNTHLSRNLVFNKNGYFYDDDEAKLVDGDDDNGGEFMTANWKVPEQYYIQSNIEIILEEPSFMDLLDRRSNFMNMLFATKSPDAKTSLEAFMKCIIDAALEVLKTADELFWLDRKAKPPIRSQYTLDYCLAQGIKLGVTKLKINNIISDIQEPQKLAKEHIKEEFEQQIRDRKKAIGYNEADALVKVSKPGKKTRKNKK